MTSTFSRETAARVRAHLTSHGITPTDLRRLINVSAWMTFTRWHGLRPWTVDALDQIATRTGAPLAWLFGVEPDGDDPASPHAAPRA